MKAIRNLLFFIGFGLVIFILLAWYSGFFAKGTIEVREIGPFYAVYLEYIGEYSETNQIKEKLYSDLWEDGIDNYKEFGIYYDKPSDTPTEEMRCKVGRVIEENQVAELARFREKYQIYTFERQKVAVIELPYVTLFSLYAGIYKAYPRLMAYANENSYAEESIIEILDDSKNILFILPLKEIE